MSKKEHEQPSPIANDERLRVASGELASGVSGQLYRPLRQLRELLGLIVDKVDRHMGQATGPTPMPWRDLEVVRQQLADAYLVCRTVTRLSNELAQATGHDSTVPEVVDVNKLVESALNLTRHAFAEGTEIFVDFGTAPPVRVVRGELTLAIATMLIAAAASSRAAPQAATSVKTFREHKQGESPIVVVYIADNGHGGPAVGAARHVVETIAERIGASFDATIEAGQGAVFELRLEASR